MKKINIYIFFLNLIFFLSFSSCTADFFDFSTDTTGEREFTSPMVYCNKFNENGFRGVITAYYDWDNDIFNKNKAQFYFWSVPDELTYPPTNYIQIHLFSISNNVTNFDKKPVSFEMTGDSASSLVTTISRELLEEMGDISVQDLIDNNKFILRNIGGWDGVSVSVFDEQNKPVKTVQLLIPPFEANPHTFLNNSNREQRLLQLHPFAKISDNPNNTDKIFYEKGIESCKSAPIDFEVPSFEEYQEAHGTDEDSIDDLLKDLSLIIE